MTRISLSEFFFNAFRILLAVLTTVVAIRLLCDYDWARSALYGTSTVCSFFVGQGIVAVLQGARREPVRQESERH